MADLTLYHAPQSRSASALWMLEEVGEPCELEIFRFDNGSLRTPEYLAINPMGKVPALKHGEAVITESAAICCYLADTFPRAKLNIPVGDPRRGPYLKWLFYGPSCFEPAVIDRMLKREPGERSAIGWGSLDLVLDTISKAIGKGPYLFGDQFTAADLIIGGGLRWGMMTRNVPARPEFSAYAERVGARPAAKRANAKDREIAAAQKK
ncbi:MAG TPA: glutathione S-transferase [Xanthobacteraceae bacterium]|nr:glutathione S-transferase [Xanthobacteraceae bacterium]